MRIISLLVLLLALLSFAAAQEPQVARVLRDFETAKPTEKQLAFYSLDWAPHLAEAKERARKEGRYLFVILNTNIGAGVGFYSGHT